MALEQLLAEINGLLGPVEEQIFNEYRMPRYPVLFVVGMPRCGSTLLMQWLAQTARFAYPTNLLSRFYAAPAIGARIQQGFDYLDRMDELVPQVVRALPADANPEDIARETLTRLGFDPPPVLPIVVTSIMAHVP